MTSRNDRAGRWIAYFSVTVGATISTYANVAEKFVRFNRVTKHWDRVPDPSLDGLVLAGAAPWIVLLMTELFVRVRGNGTAAWTVRTSTAVVALAAFLTSFQHLNGLLFARDETTLTAWLYPLGIDGLMVGATAVLWQIRTARNAGRTAMERGDGTAEDDGTERLMERPAEVERNGRGAPAEAVPLRAVGDRPMGRSTADGTTVPRGARRRVSAARERRPKVERTAAAEASRPDVTDLIGPGREVAREIRERQENVTWRSLQAGLAARGVSASTARVQELRRVLAEDPGETKEAQP